MCFSGPLLKCTAKSLSEAHIGAYAHPALPILDSHRRGKRGDCKTAKIRSLSPCPRAVCSQTLGQFAVEETLATVPAAWSSEPS